MKQNTFLFILATCLAGFFIFKFTGGNGSLANPAPKKTDFEFGHETVTSDFEINCKEDLLDEVFDWGRKLEKEALDTFGSEVTEAEEQAFGKTLHEQFEYTYLKDKRFKKCNGIFKRMLPLVERGELGYTIYLIEDEVVNAWTTPGGRIYITTGIYDFCANDDELAIVIGHELGHHENLHTRRIVQKVKTGTDNFGDFLGSLSVGIYQQFSQPFSQNDELEADFCGFYLAAKAGYDPEVGIEFWKRMAEGEAENQAFKVLRSHPYSSKRHDCGKDHIHKARRDLN